MPKSNGNTDGTTKTTTTPTTILNEPNLSVEHFRNIVDQEAKKLNSLCERWSQILENNNSDNQEGENFLGAIRSTIGQAKLLMSQRFKQFSDLIDNCEFNTGKLPTRLNDLSGFWEMISFQVEDVHQKFKSLDVEQEKQLNGESNLS